MSGYKVDICGINTQELPLLKASEAKQMLTKIKDGDLTLRETFIKGNLRLVLSIVQRFSQSGENLDDLFQIGCVGMIKAMDNFDLSLNVQFSTYAVPMIIGEIKRFLRDNSSMRISRSIKDNAFKAMSAKEELIRATHKEPSISEIAKASGLTDEDIVIAFEAISPCVSLYEPVFNDGKDTLYVIDQIKDKKNTEETWSSHIAIKDALRRLTSRERQIITLRFFDCKTQAEVADEIGISQAQVSRLEKNALNDMKKHLC